MADSDITLALNKALEADLAVARTKAALARDEELAKTAMNALEILMSANNLTTVGSTMGTADMVPKEVYKATDWLKLYAHIQATGEFDLLHKRVSVTAMRDRHTNNELPPGVALVPFRELKLSPR